MKYMEIMAAIGNNWKTEIVIVLLLMIVVVFLFKKELAKKYVTDAEWFIKEFFAMLSNKDSFFSLKRWQTSAGFVIAEWGMIQFLKIHIDTMSLIDFMVWAAAQFSVAGYVLNKIQEEKKLDLGKEPNVDKPE